MRNEIKIGILTIIAIGMTIWGFTFIKGRNLFSSANTFIVEYNDVTGLAESASVLLRGYPVGTVKSLDFKPDDPNIVVVTLSINGDVQVPKGTTAAITSGGLMSGNVIVLEFDSFCSGADCAQSGDLLKGRRVGLVESTFGVDPNKYATQAKEDLDGLMGDLDARIADPKNDAIAAKTIRNLHEVTQNLNKLTADLGKMVGSSAGKFDGILRDMESLTDNLEKSNGQITSILGNAQTLTSNLSRLDLNSTVGKVDGTLGGVDKTLGEADETLVKLRESLAVANQSLEQVNSLMEQINSGEGTVGKLLQDDQLATDLEKTLTQLNEMGGNIQEKPYLYIPFKSRRKYYRNKKKDERDGK